MEKRTPTKTAKKAKSKADPKAALLKAAEALVLNEGYPKVTTRRLAAQAQVNPALVHYHFGSVEEILARLLTKVTERSEASLRAAFDGRPAHPDHLRELFSAIIPDAVATGQSKQWIECIAMSLNRPEMRDHVRQQFAGVGAVLVEHVQATVESKGVEADDVLLQGVAALIHAAADGIVLQLALGYDEGAVALRRLIDAVLDGPVADHDAGTRPRARSTER